MSQNNFMYEWKKAKEHYDILNDGSIQMHEDAPQHVKDSFHEHERIMGKVKQFPKKKSSLFSRKASLKEETHPKNMKVKSVPQEEHTNMNVKAIFDNNEKKNVAKLILDDLQNWFAIESAKQEYIMESMNMPFWAYYEDGKAVGFIAIKKHTIESGEVYVMGVKEEYHRKHIGSALLKECERWCKSDGIKYLQVKTVSEDSDDAFYAKTRAFYKKVGFTPIEVFPTLWDENNPCLLMIKKL